MAASKTTVAALMIVGKADLAQIMAVAKKPPAGTERSRKPHLTINAARATMEDGAAYRSRRLQRAGRPL